MSYFEPAEPGTESAHEAWLRLQSNKGDKPQPLTVESLILSLDEMMREGEIQPETKVCIHVQDSNDCTGSEACYDYLTIGCFGKIVSITPFWKLGQHYSKRPNEEPTP